ncbi:hypothetical protein LRAMOSA08294 [Lichtheimia ramosa]|uniref:BHLH domain-containing protein n=1 Tax=Lichtheimia ramosa TaxID=688394 RepID=A0A077WDL6_9FUNG|nr:hypothetical protein LRAMOSA08294 [Lichtheimia ramosa]
MVPPFEEMSFTLLDEPVKSPSPPPNGPLFLKFSADLSSHQKTAKKVNKPKRQTTYLVNGVNILNRNEVDSKTAIERIQRRRENHNHVERRRRDNINNTILQISQLVPEAQQHQTGQKPNKGKVLEQALDYIQALQKENQELRQQLSYASSSSYASSTPSSFSSPSSSSSSSSLI